MSRINKYHYVFTLAIPLVMCGLLFYGASWQFFLEHSDAAKYSCYAVGFWQGNGVLDRTFLPERCAFILHPRIPYLTNEVIAHWLWQNHFPNRIVQFVASQSTNAPFHALPHEYPLIALIIFLPGLLGPLYWYQIIFAGVMGLFAVITYFALLHYKSRSAALVGAIYLVAGGWVTVMGRYDMAPAALTLIALLCAVHKRWNWAFSVLALATMTKFYPAILVIPFLLAQQQEVQGTGWNWRRMAPLSVFVGVCALIVVISLTLSVEGTVGPFSYFGIRPTQIESFQATLLWIASLIKQKPLAFEFTFGSLNIVSTLSGVVSLIGMGMLGLGLLVTYWLQWKRKMPLAVSCLLTLLIIMLTGKVFSPQYYIWVAPLLAYVFAGEIKWVIPWTLIGALTTAIYPYIYYLSDDLLKVPTVPLFFPVTAIRNLLLLACILALIIHYVRLKSQQASIQAQNISPSQEQQIVDSLTSRA